MPFTLSYTSFNKLPLKKSVEGRNVKEDLDIQVYIFSSYNFEVDYACISYSIFIIVPLVHYKPTDSTFLNIDFILRWQMWSRIYRWLSAMFGHALIYWTFDYFSCYSVKLRNLLPIAFCVLQTMSSPINAACLLYPFMAVFGSHWLFFPPCPDFWQRCTWSVVSTCWGKIFSPC